MKKESSLKSPAFLYRHHVRLKRLVFFASVSLMFTSFAASTFGDQPKPDSSIVELGARLFADTRFSSPEGDLQSSCSSCHMVNEDPQGVRVYTDFFARSWVSWRSQDPRRDGLRNAPTILDSAELPQLHYDGEFGSLEELVKGTISGRTLGWLPGEQQKALDHAYQVIVSDTGDGKTTGSSYKDRFNLAYGVSLEQLKRDEVINFAARAVSDFIRTLKTEKNSAYDRFIRSNNLPERPGQMETSTAFAERMLAQISSLETESRLKLAKDFGADELKGLKIFFSTKGAGPVGNCGTCHTPPMFTDFTFHNTGISQIEYDRHHGDGSFENLAIPDAGRAVRPSAQMREIPTRSKPGYVDLGYWNFVKLNNSPLRREKENDNEFLNRMIATFKTPTLRNLSFSYPYMHNGAYSSLDSVVEEKMLISEMARKGRIRSADEELAKTKIAQTDIRLLVTFLRTLNE
jgi:cytochrome c peroxidase